MFTPGEYRQKAAEYGERSKAASSRNEQRELQDLQKRFTVLGNDAQWLADHRDPAVRVPAAEFDPVTLEHDEEHSLRCLGAALILQWNTVPKKLRRELLDNAVSIGELLESGDFEEWADRALRAHRNGGEPM